MKKELIINKKKYELPKMDVDTYMEYLRVRESIMGTGNGMYTVQQFQDMMDCICLVYGNQFTVEELKDRETGLSVSEIIMEFVAIEGAVGKEVDGKIDKFRENFLNGK
uniref:Uncharacterized protein n=1 Tax=Myoviridae sp. ctBvM24 TaxID=2825050 RepID=A0A8S5UD06_9CAUD|nr:MAG TPA: hypothetical protein [Myoviridae sp. ctBvM24]